MRPVTPRGFRDVLFDEAAERAVITAAMRAVFGAWGFRDVETPLVEDYAVLAAGVGPSVDVDTFKLFDSDGTLLALRPEMTVPIARLAASRLRLAAGPQRICYVAEVVREQASLSGQARQFTQAGIELIGACGPDADAEVVAVLVEALDATGLPQFVVGIGTVAVLRALLGSSGADADWQAAVLGAAHDRNLVELDALVNAAAVPTAVANALREVPRLRGGREAIDACRVHAAACGCESTLDELAETWRLLQLASVADRVRIDFGILRSFDYYTGLIIEAYAPGLGLPLGGGGRYDGVLGEFGAAAPAAGFALGVDRVHIALAEQGCQAATQGLDAVIGGADAGEVFAAAASLRTAGWRVRRAASTQREPLAKEAQMAGARPLWVENGEVDGLGRDE